MMSHGGKKRREALLFPKSGHRFIMQEWYITIEIHAAVPLERQYQYQFNEKGCSRNPANRQAERLSRGDCFRNEAAEASVARHEEIAS